MFSEVASSYLSLNAMVCYFAQIPTAQARIIKWGFEPLLAVRDTQ
jgi:hypothetical protein